MKKSMIVACASLVALFLSGCGNAEVKLVKGGCSPAYPDVTMEGGYDYALKSPKWKSFTTEKKQRVVEVKGEVKNEELRKYVLNEFFKSVDVFTEEEQAFKEKYGFIESEIYISISQFIEQEDPSEIEGFVKKNLSKFNRDYNSIVVTYNNRRQQEEENLRRCLDILNIDSNGEIPELLKRLKVIEKQDPEFKGENTWNAKSTYTSYKEYKAEADSLEDKIEDIEDYIADTQKQLERDREKAQKTRGKFIKSFWDKSDPIITAQFVVHVDGKRFTSGAVTATLDGGPWDGKELSLDTSEWESLIFSN